MSKFDWQSRLSAIYSRYPEARRLPVIGVTGNYRGGETLLAEAYYKRIAAAGGVPLIIPPLADSDIIINTLERIDGLLLSGGGDYNPLYSGEEPCPALRSINGERDLPELLITRLAYNRQLPMLGICRGIQTLAMALGGKVEQDIASKGVKHSQDGERGEATHSVTIVPGTMLAEVVLGGEDPHSGFHAHERRLYVNSFHHQAVRCCGKRFRVAATAADGVIEAMESAERKPVIGVQWHPECLGEDNDPLFRWIVSEARLYRRARDIHRRAVILDSHCDTPMLFPKNIDFGKRDERILVDIHKMEEGGLDAVVMAAYLPQEMASRRDGSPSQYADGVFDGIERVTGALAPFLSIARSPADVYANKREGRRSVLLAIENALALEGRIEKVEHFAHRGVIYITLCHNGDNDVCDSARGLSTHNGVSPFGAAVIAEMNRLGVMVDMSHSSEKSFYDALDISAAPVICSHSSCRALCDSPRNLSDDQMRALARKGGVMQITCYHGFLVDSTREKERAASITDVTDHLDHAVEVMGVDHVGLGTDFDGDGGVTGLADSSEMINFTRYLLRRRYSESDIEKIWGGNFLRVMLQAQDMRR